MQAGRDFSSVGGGPRDSSANRRAWGLECRQEGISVQLEEGLGTGVRQEEIQHS